MPIPFIDLKSQYDLYKNEILHEINKVLDSSQFIMGSQVDVLEQSLAKYVQAKYSIACSSGTDALLVALLALDIKKDDEIITTPFTFIATAEVISLLGAKPVFVDIDENTYNIDENKIEEKINHKTKAIMPVSLYGQCSNMDKINEIASKHGIFVIEDGAQSFGATYKGKKSCALSQIGCTSFFPSKPLGCYGDGGAIFCDDEKLMKKIKMIINHGQEQRYKHDVVGINGRLDALQAAVLNVKLKYFDQELKKRQEIAKRYDENLQDIVQTPILGEDNTHVYAQYTIQVDNRDEFCDNLKQFNIPTAVHYPIPLHLQNVFKYLGYKKGDFPISEKIANRVLSLPMSPFLTKEHQDLVIEAIRKVLS